MSCFKSEFWIVVQKQFLSYDNVVEIMSYPSTVFAQRNKNIIEQHSVQRYMHILRMLLYKNSAVLSLG